MPPHSASNAATSAVCVDGNASQLLHALVEAYRGAWYEVALPGRATVSTLQVDVHSPALEQAMQALGASHACLLTACNPHGQPLSPMDNESRMLVLRDALQREGWTWAPAFGRDPRDQWPGEDSLLIWHMDRTPALLWGQRWEQNALLTVGRDAIPRLELLR